MTNLSEADLKVFVDGVRHYFSHLTEDAAEIRAAYLAQEAMPYFDYTGLIAVSGRFRGIVYFSAPRALVRELLVRFHETDFSEANLLDAVGEVANTLAGNARRHFGSKLDISVPVSIRGITDEIRSAVRSRAFSILLRWQRHEAVVVVDLEPA